MHESGNASQVAKLLGISGQAVRNWQRDFGDAPKTFGLEEWKAFIERNSLGVTNNRKSKRREDLLVEKLASEVRLNEIKIAQAEARLIAADEVDNFLLFLGSRVKSAIYQSFTTELPPKVAGLEVGEVRKLARESADVVCVSMQNALEEWQQEQKLRRKAAEDATRAGTA